MKLLSIFKKERFPSGEEALAKIIGKKEYREIEKRCPDKRRIFELAANELEITERELIQRVSDELGCGVAPRLVTTEIEALPLDVNLNQMRRAGCIVVVRDRIFRGVVCVDPARIPQQLKSLSQLEYLIAPWSEISIALNASERRYESHKESFVEETVDEIEEDRVDKSIVQVLEFLIEEVKQYEVSEVKISLDGGAIHYHFTLPDGRSGQGEIHKNLHLLIEEFLTKAANDVVDVAGHAFRSEVYEEGSYYLLKWDSAPKRVKEVAPVALKPKPKPKNSSPVLIVDDSEVFGSVIERYFVRQGVEVLRKTSAVEALQDLKDGTVAPRVVVCDLHMPEMNGVEFVKEVRNDETLKNISLFMLTSDEETDTEVDLVRSGVETYLRKSEDPRLLFAHVERILGSS